VRRFEQLFVSTMVFVMGWLLLARIGERHPPYFARPRTIVDHFGRRPESARDAFLLLESASSSIPRRATVACRRQLDAPQPSDDLLYLICVGMLPDHTVQPSGLESTQYVVTFDDLRIHRVER
jgi:hypothetical protein